MGKAAEAVKPTTAPLRDALPPDLLEALAELALELCEQRDDEKAEKKNETPAA